MNSKLDIPVQSDAKYSQELLGSCRWRLSLILRQRLATANTWRSQ